MVRSTGSDSIVLASKFVETCGVSRTEGAAAVTVIASLTRLTASSASARDVSASLRVAFFVMRLHSFQVEIDFVRAGWKGGEDVITVRAADGRASALKIGRAHRDGHAGKAFSFGGDRPSQRRRGLRERAR